MEKAEWTDAEITAMLDKLEEHWIEYQNEDTKKIEVFHAIATELEEENIFYSGEQVKGKIALFVNF